MKCGEVSVSGSCCNLPDSIVGKSASNAVRRSAGRFVCRNPRPSGISGVTGVTSHQKKKSAFSCNCSNIFSVDRISCCRCRTRPPEFRRRRERRGGFQTPLSDPTGAHVEARRRIKTALNRSVFASAARCDCNMAAAA